MIHTIQQYLSTQPVERAWLFGSFSRGEENKKSDVDIFLVPDKTQHLSSYINEAEDFK